MNRRIEKLTRTVRDVISDLIQNHLSDPRIKGLVGVTRVELAHDLSVAKIYLSIAGVEPVQEKLTFEAVKNATGFMRTHLSKILTTRVCPALNFYLDDSIKKSFEVSQILDRLEYERIEKNKSAENTEDQEDEK